jgi:hypothetical protein
MTSLDAYAASHVEHRRFSRSPDLFRFPVP